MDLKTSTIHRPYPRNWERRLQHLDTIKVRQTITLDPQRPYGVGQNSSVNVNRPPIGHMVNNPPGGRCNPSGGGAPVVSNCYRTGQFMCDFQHCSNSLLNNLAGVAFGPVVIVPTNTAYFEPVAAENVVSETANPGANARVRYTAFVIGGSPQEPFDNRAPVAGTTAFMWSDHYLPGDYGPRPVSWGIFSVVAQTKDLQIFGFQPNAVAVDIEWTIYGNAMDNLPPGARLGISAMA